MYPHDVKKDSVWVRIDPVKHSGYPGQMMGDIIRASQDSSDDYIHHADGTASLKCFRAASEKECLAYARGLRNTKYLDSMYIKGDLLQCIVDHCMTTNSIVKGDIVEFYNYEPGNQSFEGDRQKKLLSQGVGFCGLKLSEFVFYSEEGVIVPKFKVGDRIIGNKDANVYGITKQGLTGTVLKILDTKEIEIKLDKNGLTYTVNSDNFNLFEKKTDDMPELKEKLEPKPAYEFKIGDKIVGNERASKYYITGVGSICIVKEVKGPAWLQVQLDSDKSSNYTVAADCFDFVSNGKTKSYPYNYKFSVGQMVVIIKSGYGIGDQHIGKRTIITECGEYWGKPGYLCSPAFGNAERGDMIGEESFGSIDSSAFVNPHTDTYAYIIGADPYKGDGVEIDQLQQIFDEAISPLMVDTSNIVMPTLFNVERI